MTYRAAWLGGVLAACLVGLIAVAASAEAPLTSASLTGPVTVSRASGGTIKGTVRACTPELLTVLPDPKPVPKGAKPPAVPPPAPEPVELAWADVRGVSNGLTARRALDIWIAQHHGDLCPTCRGERTVMCPVCKGTRHAPAAAAGCPTCHGELLVACKSAGEAGGKVPCPNNCLRLTVGNWTKGKDGKLARHYTFGTPGAGTTFTESQVGDVVLVDNKAKTATDAGKCPVCGGTILVDDPVCHATGKVPCPECLARKSAAPCPNNCDAGRVVCPTCKGSGLKVKA